MNRLVSLIICLTCVAAIPARAEIHRCTAADGSVTFSDAPCGEETTTFRPTRKPPPAAEAARNEKRDKLLRAFEEERRLEREQAAEAEAQRAERARKCAQARDDLRILTEAGSLYNLDEDGSRVYLSDEERVQAIRDTRAAVKHWCE